MFLDDTGSGPFQLHLRKIQEAGSLSGSRLKEGMAQKRFFELTGIPQSHISEMGNGKRQIGKKRAKILAKALNVGYKVFL